MKVKLATLALLATGIGLFFLFGRENDNWPVTNDRPIGGVIVAFGDSLTRGHGAAANESYPRHLSELLGYGVINEGKDGDTCESALRRVDRVIAHQPDVVIITLGGNDILKHVPIDKTLNHLREIFRRLQKAGAMVVYGAVDPPLIGGNWVAAVRELCRDEGVLYIRSLMDGLWADTEKMSDSIHPNGAGYRILAERVHERLMSHSSTASQSSQAVAGE